MGVWQRMTLIFRSKANKALDRAEDPREMLDYSYQRQTELLVKVLHSRFLQVVTHPAFTIPLFIASLYGLYFTPLFDFLMESRTGHLAMMVHFLAVGLVFFWPIMGVDPGPHRPGYVMRMLELFAGMPFHAFFGIALMMASEPLLGRRLLA